MSPLPAPGYTKITHRSPEELENWPQRKVKIFQFHFIKGAIINFIKLLEADEENYKKRIRGDYQEVRLRNNKVFHIRPEFLAEYGKRNKTAVDSYYDSLSIIGKISFTAYGIVLKNELELFKADGEPPISRLVPEEHIAVYHFCLADSIIKG